MTRGVWWLGEEENGEIPINAPEWGAFARVVVRLEDGTPIEDGYENATILVNALPMLQILTQMDEDPRLQRKLKRLGYSEKIKAVLDEKVPKTK